LKATASKKYASREAIIYYALSLPAIALQLFFSSSVAANPGQFSPQLASFGVGITELVQLLPWVLLALSILAVVRFRPSALVTLLTASFFLAAAALGESGFSGTALGLTGSVSLVILATFMALIGFNYARAAKLLGGRPALVEGQGPLGYQLLSTSLELVLPLLAAVALAVAVSAIVTTLTLQTKLLPEPLSTLSSLYLESRFGLVFVSIGVAGALIWAMRQVLEPIIMYFTLTYEDAVKMALNEVEDIAKKLRRQARVRPAAGWGWLSVSIVCVVSVSFLSLFVVSPQGLWDNLLSIFGLHGVQSGGAGDLETTARNFVRIIDSYVVQGQDIIRQIIRLLWG